MVGWEAGVNRVNGVAGCKHLLTYWLVRKRLGFIDFAEVFFDCVVTST